MGTVDVEDIICVLKNDKDLLSSWPQFLVSLQLKSIGEEEKADLKAKFEKTRDPGHLLREIVTLWVRHTKDGPTVKSLGTKLKASGNPALKFKLETTFQPENIITNNSEAGNINKKRSVETLLQIINWAGRKQECQCFLPKLLNLFNNIGSRPVVIISISGSSSSAKSVLVDEILKYLKCRDSGELKNGFSSTPLNFENGSVIRIWNESLYIKNKGKKIGVILMELHGTNPIATALSLILSSISIFLQDNGGAEQVVRWFSNFVSENEPKVYPKKLYQALSILCYNGKSDFHQNYENEIRQLKAKLSNESSKQLPAALEKYFDEVNYDIVGVPNKFSTCPISLVKYVEKLISPENLVNSVKQVCGKPQTGSSIKDYVCLWTQLATTSKEKLRPKTIVFETGNLFAFNLTSGLLAKYRRFMGEFLRNSPNLTDAKFEAFHSEIEAELWNELMNMTLAESIKKNCRTMFTVNADALKYNFLKEIHKKSRQQKISSSISISINYDEKNILGRGSSETVVYKGTFGERIVAVKRLNRVHFDLKEANKEVAALIKCDSHKNVVKFFHGEERKDYYLIALELCTCTLEKWVKRESVLDLETELDANDVLRQTTEGLAHLHRQRVIHRDIKPQNILLLYDSSTKEVCAKISDFGISKILGEHTSNAKITSGKGTEGWMAPEIFQYKVNASPNMKRTMTRASDIFALGCVYYYVLTEGIHPFGEEMRRQVNIVDDKPDICENEMEEHNQGGSTLIKKMIAKDPEERPKMTYILSHPLLWSNKRTLEFVADVSNCAKENELEELVKDAIEDLEIRAKEHVGIVDTNPQGWLSRLSPHMIDYLTAAGGKKHKGQIKYNGKIVKQLLRAIRNMRNHFGDLPVEVQNEVGKPDDFIRYWMEKFPHLLSSTWVAFEKVALEAKFGLHNYYRFE